jgi:hypothetical protein
VEEGFGTRRIAAADVTLLDPASSTTDIDSKAPL